MDFKYDSTVIKSFLAIAESGSFSKAAGLVGRSQSAISLQIKRLEENLGCLLFRRGKSKVTLTEQGDIFLDYARQSVELQWDVLRRLNESAVHGDINLGTPEDFATHYLSEILAVFAREHPHIQLHVSCDLTLNLLNDFKDGKLDIALIKRDPDIVEVGSKVWEEPLVWAAADDYKIKSTIPLVIAPKPCIYRSRAITALDRVRRPWVVAYTSPSLAGSIAAVRAGLGVAVLPANMLPKGISQIQGDGRLPSIAASEIALLSKPSLSMAGNVLVDHIVSSLGT